MSSRTLRSWLRSAPKVEPDKPKPRPVTPPPKPPRPPRPSRRPRFGFDVTLPDTQHAADPAGLRAFGIDLEMVAAQDVGGRDRDLLDAVIIDPTKSAERVAKVLTQALQDKAGAQLALPGSKTRCNSLSRSTVTTLQTSLEARFKTGLCSASMLSAKTASTRSYALHSPTSRHSRPPTKHFSFPPTSSPISSSPPGPQRARHSRRIADFRGRTLGITTCGR